MKEIAEAYLRFSEHPSATMSSLSSQRQATNLEDSDEDIFDDKATAGDTYFCLLKNQY